MGSQGRIPQAQRQRLGAEVTKKPSEKDQHIKELQKLIAGYKTANEIHMKCLDEYRKLLEAIKDMIDDAL
jgi:hypothetical protein